MYLRHCEHCSFAVQQMNFSTNHRPRAPGENKFSVFHWQLPRMQLVENTARAKSVHYLLGKKINSMCSTQECNSPSIFNPNQFRRPGRAGAVHLMTLLICHSLFTPCFYLIKHMPNRFYRNYLSPVANRLCYKSFLCD